MVAVKNEMFERYRNIDSLTLLEIIEDSVEYVLDVKIADICDLEQANCALEVLKERMKETHP